MSYHWRTKEDRILTHIVEFSRRNKIHKRRRDSVALRTKHPKVEFYYLVYYSMPSCVHTSWWDYHVSYIVFQSRWNARIIARILGRYWNRHEKYICVSCLWANFHVIILLVLVEDYTPSCYVPSHLIHKFSFDIFCSCMIQYFWYLEKLMDYIVYGLYGTSCARGGPHIYMWYWFMMVILWHERCIHDSCHFLEFHMPLHFTW